VAATSQVVIYSDVPNHVHKAFCRGETCVLFVRRAIDRHEVHAMYPRLNHDEVLRQIALLPHDLQPDAVLRFDTDNSGTERVSFTGKNNVPIDAVIGGLTDL
jgi:hypothetical protein